MQDSQQANFSGWAVLELFGHSREAGHVTTEYFGTAAMFRVDVPELPEREVTLTRPEWIDEASCYAPAGSKVSRAAVPGRTRFISPGAIYAMNPCDEAAVVRAIESMVSRKVKIIELAPGKQLTAPVMLDENYQGPDPDEEENEEELPVAEDPTPEPADRVAAAEWSTHVPE